MGKKRIKVAEFSQQLSIALPVSRSQETSIFSEGNSKTCFVFFLFLSPDDLTIPKNAENNGGNHICR